ncbi:MAG: hypothetical protein ACOCRX_01760 [Candidatus Woesearchaeota archaeon]
MKKKELNYHLITYKPNDSLMKKFRDSKFFKGITIGAITLGLTLLSPSYDSVKNFFSCKSKLERLVEGEYYNFKTSSQNNLDSEDIFSSLRDGDYSEFFGGSDFILNDELSYESVMSVDNSEVRQIYLESMMKKVYNEYDVSPPSQLRDATYLNENDDLAIMSVNYRPIKPKYKGKIDSYMSLYAYKHSFNLNDEDDFISTIFHEYNHVRALNREKIIGENEDYLMNYDEIKNNETLSNLTWYDLYDKENYSLDETIYNDLSSSKLRSEIRDKIRREITEMLAVAEEIDLNKDLLDVSFSYKNSRYSLYKGHYNDLFKYADEFNMKDDLENKLKEIFHQPWFDYEMSLFY